MRKNSSQVNTGDDVILFTYPVVTRHPAGIHFLDVVRRITIQMAPCRSREHLVQYRRVSDNGSRHFCLQHGVRKDINRIYRIKCCVVLWIFSVFNAAFIRGQRIWKAIKAVLVMDVGQLFKRRLLNSILRPLPPVPVPSPLCLPLPPCSCPFPPLCLPLPPCPPTLIM